MVKKKVKEIVKKPEPNFIEAGKEIVLFADKSVLEQEQAIVEISKKYNVYQTKLRRILADESKKIKQPEEETTKIKKIETYLGRIRRIVRNPYNKSPAELEEEGYSEEKRKEYIQEAEEKRQHGSSWETKLRIADQNVKDFIEKELERISELDEYNQELEINRLASDFGITKTILQKNLQKYLPEQEKTGIVPKAKDNEKQQIVLPGLGKLIGWHFANELGAILSSKNTIFYRPESRDVVEIGTFESEIQTTKQDTNSYIGFSQIKPNRFITLIENYVCPGVESWNVKAREMEFKLKSLSPDAANTVLCSNFLHSKLKKVDRIFTVPLPIMYNKKLTFPKVSYDERFESWLPYNAPKISDINMSLEEAKKIIEEIYKEFCFKTEQDKHNAIAALLTPFLRGMYSHFSVRTPVFFYEANRERCGKDYCAGVTSIVYEGCVIECSPISNSEKHGGNNTDEFRKRMVAALLAGRKRMHFSNNKGFIDNAEFESLITNERPNSRILGKNDSPDLNNEIDFSLSGNIGITFTADFANRCRFVRLFLDIEDANARSFKTPDLHGIVKKDRERILSALYTLIRNWIDNGKKPGSIPFASFPQWSEICGGIMEAAGYLNPCKADKEVLMIGGDRLTQEMKQIYEEAYFQHPEEPIDKPTIKEIARTLELSYDFSDKSDSMKFASNLMKFNGRIQSGIRLELLNLDKHSRFHQYYFTKSNVEKDIKQTNLDEKVPPLPPTHTSHSLQGK